MKILIVCHFYSIYIKELINQMNKYSGIRFDILTMDSQYRKEFENDIVENVFIYKTIDEFSNIITKLPDYSVVEVHFLAPFYGYFSQLIRNKAETLNLCIWGSDYLRVSDEDLKIQKQIIDLADYIILGNPDVLKQFKQTFGLEDNKLKTLRFGLSILDQIEQLKENQTKIQVFRNQHQINAHKKIVVIGHNASSGQNHIEMIQSLSGLDKAILEEMQFVWPLTYGGDRKYVDKVIEVLNQSPLDTVVLDKYMSTEEVACLRIISDIFVQLQKTDQLSGAMQEHLFTNSVVITGAWLPYKVLEDDGVQLLKIDTISQLANAITDVYNKYDKMAQRFENNYRIIKSKASWTSIAPQWDAIYCNEEGRLDSNGKLKANINQMIQTSNFDFANELLIHYRALYGDDLFYNVAKGLVSYYQQEFDMAKTFFDYAYLIDPYDADVLYNLGMVYGAIGFDDVSLLYFKRAQNQTKDPSFANDISVLIDEINRDKEIIYPKITVGVISYNSMQFIDSCLKSIEEQDYPNIEIFIVDDLSKDGTQEFIKSYQSKKCQYSFLIHEQNAGSLAPAMHEMITLSNSRYLSIISNDDAYASSNTLSDFYVHFRNNESLDFVYSNMAIINEDNCIYDYWYSEKPTEEDVFKKAYHTGSGQLPMAMGMFDLSFFDGLNIKYIIPDIQTPKGNSGSDTLNMLYYLKNGLKFDKISTPLMQYRIHQNNISNNMEARIHSNFYVQEYLVDECLQDVLGDNILEKNLKIVKIDHLWTYVKGYLSGQYRPGYLSTQSINQKDMLHYCQPFINLLMQEIECLSEVDFKDDESMGLFKEIAITLASVDKAVIKKTRLEDILASLLADKKDKLQLQHIRSYTAISFYGRSGSVFLQSLFDSHPQVVMMPALYLMDYGRFWENIDDNASANEIVSFFIDYYQYLFNPNFLVEAPKDQPWVNIVHYSRYDEMGDNQNIGLYVDKHKFELELRLALITHKKITRELLFKAAHVAYFNALNRPFDSQVDYTLMYAMHTSLVNDTHHLWFLKDFPNSKILYMVRNPLTNIVSLLKYQQTNDLVTPDSLMTIFYQMGIMTGPQQLINLKMIHQIKAVKLEDLHNNSHETLRLLTDYLGLEWHDCLLESTFNGHKWWNFRDTVCVNGFGNHIGQDVNKSFLNDRDQKLLKTILYPFFAQWHYKASQYYDLEDCIKMLEKPFQFEAMMVKQCGRPLNRKAFLEAFHHLIQVNDSLGLYLENIKLLGE